MTTTDKALNALTSGVQYPFEIRMFTIAELTAMKTATSNAQAPLDLKRSEKLAQSLASTMQLDPFKVVDLNGELILGAGRHRLHCQGSTLQRPAGMAFACLYYSVTTTEQANRIIMGDNDTRPTRKPEKLIMAAAGSTGKLVGEEDLSDNYAVMLTDGALKSIKDLFLAESLAKLSQILEDTELSGTTLVQILNPVWNSIFTARLLKPVMAVFYAGSANIYALQDMFLTVLPEALRKCMERHPHTKSWSRDGKQFLIDAAIKAITDSLLNGFKFPLMPEVTPSTETKKPAVKPVATKKTPMKMSIVAPAMTLPLETPVIEAVTEAEAIPL